MPHPFVRSEEKSAGDATNITTPDLSDSETKSEGKEAVTTIDTPKALSTTEPHTGSDAVAVIGTNHRHTTRRHELAKTTKP